MWWMGRTRVDRGLKLNAWLLGERLRLARWNAGLTQEALAQAVQELGFDLTPRLIGIYEGYPSKPASVPPLHTFLAMLAVLRPPGLKKWFSDALPEEIRWVWDDNSSLLSDDDTSDEEAPPRIDQLIRKLEREHEK